MMWTMLCKNMGLSLKWLSSFLLIFLITSQLWAQSAAPRFHGGITAEDETTFVDVLSDGTSNRFASDAIIKARDPQNNLVEKKESGVVDAASTATPLGAGGSFVSPWIDSDGYTNLAIMVFTDQDSATNGLIIELSSDGTNVDLSDEYSIGANTGEQYTIGITAKFFRVRYINGAIAQGAFRLQTTLYINAPKASSHRIDDPVDGENDAELVKAVKTAKDSNGSFVNERAGGIVNSNSSTTTLGAAGTFTGDYFSLIGYGGFTVFIETDQDGTLHIDTSTDGTNFVTRTFKVTGGMEFVNGFSPSTMFARVRYVNGGVAQTFFRLQTINYVQQLSPSSQPINTSLNVNTIATNSRSILAGQREDGVFDNVDLSNSSSMKVAITDRPSEVRGRTLIEIPVVRTALSGTPTVIYTVTAGKTLYITSFSFSMINDANAIGEIRLQDDTIVKDAFLMNQKITGNPSTQSSTSPSLPEPMKFTTDVNFIQITGTVEIAGFLIGYEE